MTKRIIEFTATEASVCKRGANQHANHFIVKSDDTTSDTMAEGVGDINTYKENDTTMTDVNKAENGEMEKGKGVKGSDKEMTKTDEAIKKMEEQIETLTKVAGLTGDEKSHYDSIEKDEDKVEFLNKSSEDKAEAIKKALADKEATEVTIGGRVFKSDDVNGIAMAKELEELKKDKADAEVNEFIEKNLKALPGDKDVVKSTVATIFKSFTGKEREDALGLLVAKNDKLAKQMETFSDSLDEDEAGEGEMDAIGKHDALVKKAKEIRKDDPEISDSDAFAIAMRENPELC